MSCIVHDRSLHFVANSVLGTVSEEAVEGRPNVRVNSRWLHKKETGEAYRERERDREDRKACRQKNWGSIVECY